MDALCEKIGLFAVIIFDNCDVNFFRFSSKKPNEIARNGFAWQDKTLLSAEPGLDRHDRAV